MVVRKSKRKRSSIATLKRGAAQDLRNQRSKVQIDYFFHDKVYMVYNKNRVSPIYRFSIKNKVIKTTNHVMVRVLQTSKPRNGNKISEKSLIQVYCSCDDFKYRMAYRLNKRLQLIPLPSIKKALGRAVTEEPTRKAPRSKLCKHLIKVVSEVDKWKNN